MAEAGRQVKNKVWGKKDNPALVATNRRLDNINGRLQDLEATVHGIAEQGDGAERARAASHHHNRQDQF